MLDDKDITFSNSHDTDSQESLQADLAHYRSMLVYLGGNVPISALCLPKRYHNCLAKDGCERVYDLISRDFTKIKGLGEVGADLISSRLDQFFSVSI